MTLSRAFPKVSQWHACARHVTIASQARIDALLSEAQSNGMARHRLATADRAASVRYAAFLVLPGRASILRQRPPMGRQLAARWIGWEFIYLFNTELLIWIKG
jgi:hypothetical protein